jgi:hypothetical protein
VPGHPAREPELRQFLGPDLWWPVGQFEGRGLEGNLTLGVEDRLLQSLADLVRNRQPLPYVFRARSLNVGSPGLVLLDLDEPTEKLPVVRREVISPVLTVDGNTVDLVHLLDVRVDYPRTAPLSLAALLVRNANFRRPPQPGITAPASGLFINAFCNSDSASSDSYWRGHTVNSSVSINGSFTRVTLRS